MRELRSRSHNAVRSSGRRVNCENQPGLTNENSITLLDEIIYRCQYDLSMNIFVAIIPGNLMQIAASAYKYPDA